MVLPGGNRELPCPQNRTSSKNNVVLANGLTGGALGRNESNVGELIPFNTPDNSKTKLDSAGKTMGQPATNNGGVIPQPAAVIKDICDIRNPNAAPPTPILGGAGGPSHGLAQIDNLLIRHKE